MDIMVIINNERKIRKITIKELSNAAGCSAVHMSNCLRGSGSNVSFGIVTRCLDYLRLKLVVGRVVDVDICKSYESSVIDRKK